MPSIEYQIIRGWGMRVEVDITTSMDSHKLGKLIYEEIADYLGAVMDKHAIVKFREFDDLDRMGEYISVMAEDISTTYKHIIIIRVIEESDSEPNGYGSAIIVGTNDENEVGMIEEMVDIGVRIKET